MIFREIVQDRGIDRVLAEDRLVPFEAEAPQPTPDVHDCSLSVSPQSSAALNNVSRALR